MSNHYHKSSFTDVLFFIAIIAVLFLALGADSPALRGLFKSMTAFFR